MIWTILFVMALVPIAQASGADRPCKEIYASMPRRFLNHIPAIILNTKDKGSDVFRQDTAALVAEKTDDCTVTYKYYEQGEQNPPTCSETVSFCPVSSPLQDISTQSSSTNAPVIDHDALRKKQIEEETRAYEEEKEERRYKGQTWENAEELEEFLTVTIKYKEDGDKETVLEDIKSVGGVSAIHRCK
jgi:hypothetical protein